MAGNEGFRRYFEAAAVLGEITRARAEEMARELMSSGDMGRAQAQEWVDELMGRSRKAAEELLGLVRTEVANQLQALGIDPEELARQAADIMRRSAAAGRQAVRDATPGAKKSGGAKKTTAKKSGGAKKTAAAKTAAAAKKSTGKKSAAKAPAAKKTASTRAPAKKSGAKKAAPTSGAS